MTIKLISVLHGSSNSGKTSTLRELCKLLSEEENAEQLKLIRGNGKRSKIENRVGLNFEIPLSGDFATIIRINSSNKAITIGVGTAGDESGILQRNFELFKECDIVFCATKSAKSSIKYLYDTYLPSNEFAHILPFYKYRVKEEYKEKSNINLAQNILTVTKLYWNNIYDD